MIVLGAILAVVGWLIGFAILLWVGLILLVVGAVLAVAGHAGHPVGSRNHYW